MSFDEINLPIKYKRILDNYINFIDTLIMLYYNVNFYIGFVYLVYSLFGTYNNYHFILSAQMYGTIIMCSYSIYKIVVYFDNNYASSLSLFLFYEILFLLNFIFDIINYSFNLFKILILLFNLTILSLIIISTFHIAFYTDNYIINNYFQYKNYNNIKINWINKDDEEDKEDKENTNSADDNLSFINICTDLLEYRIC
jgi:hypothetical protein